MDVVRLPRSFRAAHFFFLMLVPLAGLEAWIISRQPWWSLPLESMGVAMILALLVFLPLLMFMARGGRWALWVTGWLAGAWTFINTWISIRLQLPILGFFTIFLCCFLALVTLWIRKEMSRSFFDPKLQWFQALPKPIPGLVCQVNAGEVRTLFKVSRMDEEGAFLFRDRGVESQVGSKLFFEGDQELVFLFRDRELRCKGAPVRLLDRGMGGGFQFRDLSPDHIKNLGDFVESLRGEGYVA